MLFLPVRRTTAACALALSAALLPAQTPPPAAAAPARQSGTVKSIEGTSLTVVTKDGPLTIPVAADAKVLELAPGSTDLKTAQPAKFSDIAVGDKVLTGKAGDTATATRIIVMKSGAIAARNEEQQADWQKRGASGIVKSVDGTSFAVAEATKTVKITTSSSTIFKRYAPDSIKFQDAAPGTLAQIQAGDQLSVRGNKSDDGATIAADEVVTGTFSNLSGILTAVDAATGTVSLKDLTTKKAVTVKLTANADVRQLPPQAAAMFAQRAGGAAGPGGPPQGNGAGAGARSSNGAGAGANAGPGAAAGAGMGGGGRPGGSAGAEGAPGAGRARAGMDLSRMLARLPTETVADLKPGTAVMIVASPSSTPGTFTAITLLSGVEALLSAPGGAQPLTLSPWNLGAPEGGGGGGGQ